MPLMVEKGTRGGICQVIHEYAKANNKYMKNLTKRLRHHILRIWIQTICMDQQCLKNFLQTVLNG